MEQSLQAAFAVAARAETPRSIVELAIQAPAVLDDTKGEILDAMEGLSTPPFHSPNPEVLHGAGKFGRSCRLRFVPPPPR